MVSECYYLQLFGRRNIGRSSKFQTVIHKFQNNRKGLQVLATRYFTFPLSFPFFKPVKTLIHISHILPCLDNTERRNKSTEKKKTLHFYYLTPTVVLQCYNPLTYVLFLLKSVKLHIIKFMSLANIPDLNISLSVLRV